MSTGNLKTKIQYTFIVSKRFWNFRRVGVFFIEIKGEKKRRERERERVEIFQNFIKIFQKKVILSQLFVSFNQSFTSHNRDSKAFGNRRFDDDVIDDRKKR